MVKYLEAEALWTTLRRAIDNDFGKRVAESFPRNGPVNALVTLLPGGDL